jgi:hypothetical protein
MVSDSVQTEEAVTAPETSVTADEACFVCGHPMSAHDAIGTRFCAATAAGALSRGCICHL